MTPYILQTLTAVTILLAVALLADLFLRLVGSSASQRHALLLAALGGTLILPVVIPLVPKWTPVSVGACPELETVVPYPKLE